MLQDDSEEKSTKYLKFLYLKRDRNFKTFYNNKKLQRRNGVLINDKVDIKLNNSGSSKFSMYQT